MIRAPRLSSFVVVPLAVAAVLVLALPAQAAGGALDTSWGGTGVVATPFPAADSFGDGVITRGNEVIVAGGAGEGQGAFAPAKNNRDGFPGPNIAARGEGPHTNTDGGPPTTP